MNVVDMVFFWARTDPHRAAIIQPEMVTTFQGLADAIESICERIDRLALDKREPIAVSLANPSFFIATAFAVLRCGYSAALVNSPLFPQLQPAGIRNLIYDTQGLVLSGGRNIRFDMSWLPAAAPSARQEAVSAPARSATSVSSGSPRERPDCRKCTCMRRAAFDQRLACPVSSWANGDHKRALIMPGIAGSFGFNRTCEMLFAGKSACFAPSPRGCTLADRYFQHRCRICVAATGPGARRNSGKKDPVSARVGENAASCRGERSARNGPQIAQPRVPRDRDSLCLDRGRNGRQRPLRCDRENSAGGRIRGAGCRSRDRRRGRRRAADRRGWADPPAHPATTIEPRTQRTPVPSPDARAAWFYPGDIGRLTEHGVLCVTGRSSDVINSGGVKVSATRIEDVLQALPEIREAAACGVMGRERARRAVARRRGLRDRSTLPRSNGVSGAQGDRARACRGVRARCASARRSWARFSGIRLKEHLLELKKGG